MSVTSFGALAALCSVVLGTWQKRYHGQGHAA
jgi:cytochrome oxidase assembly protein ShyY1